MNGSLMKIIVYCDNLSATHFIKNSIESVDVNFDLHFCSKKDQFFHRTIANSEFDACLFWLKKEDQSTLIEKQGLITEHLPLFVISEEENEFDTMFHDPSVEFIFKKDLNPVFLVKSLINLVEKFNLRKQISRSEKQYNDLFYNTPLPLMIFDTRNEKILRVNDEATNIFGFSEEEFIGFNLKRLQRIDNFNENSIDFACPIKEGEVNFSGTFRFRNKEKELKYFDIFIKANSLNIDHRLIMVTDVTKRVLFDELLGKAIFEAQENERFELGSELHDNVCQILATGQLSLDLLEGYIPQDNPFLNRGKEMFKLAIDEIRRLSHRLAPAFFDNSTLDYLLGGIKDCTENDPFDLKIRYSECLNEIEFSKALQLNLYRILQEQIQNIRKHAQAKNVYLEVYMVNEKLIVKIKDDGVGFNYINNSRGIGINNIKRRMEKLSGEITINSSVGMGCEIILQIPIEMVMVT